LKPFEVANQIIRPTSSMVGSNYSLFLS